MTSPFTALLLHGIEDGEKRSRVIIDTIEAHKTVALGDIRVFTIIVKGGATITCANYSKPLGVPSGSRTLS